MVKLCRCKHEYASHAWGTGFCSAKDCKCLVFRETLCPCGHAWEAHGLIDGDPEHLICPSCGKNCENWRKPVEKATPNEVWEKALAAQPDPKIETKPEDKDPDDVCVCGHSKRVHSDDNGYECAECWNEPNRPNELVCSGYLSIKDTAGADIAEDFDTVNRTALAQVQIPRMTGDTVPKYTGYSGYSGGYSGSYSSPGGYTGQTFVKSCYHKPSKVLTGKEWEVWAGTKSECNASLHEFTVILNCAGMGTVIPHHHIPFAWAKKYEEVKAKEIRLDWPDGGIPMINPQFWGDLLKHLKKTHGKLLAFCIGGHGRTGTAVASMFLAAGCFDRDPRKVKNWIWKNYCRRAIETEVQEKYIDGIAKYYKEKALKAKKAKVN